MRNHGTWALVSGISFALSLLMYRSGDFMSGFSIGVNFLATILNATLWYSNNRRAK